MVSSREYAALAAGSYQSPPKPVLTGTAEFEVVKHVDLPSGYQATLYRRAGTNEYVLAHRGTETGRGLGELFRDGVATDLGMVRTSLNRQTPDALAFTRLALDYVSSKGGVLTVTGHSLGGCLAQITASHYGLRARRSTPTARRGWPTTTTG
ncbi:hypothetical protein ACFOED_11560 [Vulcaniibacterium thermophilum]|uniref:Lipase (Class 3) n=1 Tax=Vulcaniibacterium thermophilum TaxID=1169913 RepID=A0A918ZDN1_9GAMM|nr:hypothetical protein [Vulcaniibacterium thermophilum]GHE44334.1 hypothetical protein GCM10007167_27570 [Vulcaniibacterium thermophilum]